MIKTIIKGFLIGAAKVIPGFSGSLLAMIFGVYEQTLNIIVNIRKITLKQLLFLFNLGFGIILGIVLFSMLVKFLLAKLYFPVMLLFIGMIISSVKVLFNETKNYLITFKGTSISLISIILVLGLDFIKSDSLITVNNYLYFPLGIVEALTTLIPGISGTSIYMIFDVYDVVLDFYANIFNVNNFINVIYFGLGLITGIYLVSKIILFFLEKYRLAVLTMIFGFMVGAIAILLKDTLLVNFNIWDVIMGLFLLLLGYKMVNHIFKLNA